MRDDACGEAERVTDQMQVIAELNNDSYFASWTCQQPTIGRQRIEGAEESKPLDKVRAKASMGTMRSVLSLPSGTWMAH